MKKIFFSIFTLIFMSLTAASLHAQGMGGWPGMGMHKPFQHLEMLQYTFDLTNAQVDKIYKIEKDYMDQFYQNRKDPEKNRELADKFHSEIEALLTAEQKIKWNDFRKNQPYKEKNKKNIKRPGAGPFMRMGMLHLHFLQKDLGLSDEQTDRIYKVHRDYLDKFYQNRNDGDKVRELRTKQNADIEKILTAEQKTKWNELKNKTHRYRDKSGKGKPGHPYWADDDKK